MKQPRAFFPNSKHCLKTGSYAVGKRGFSGTDKTSSGLILPSSVHGITNFGDKW